MLDRNAHSRIAAVLVGLGLATGPMACTVGPDYQPPEVTSPESYRFALDEAVGDTDGKWWEGFNDPALTSLIEEALRANYDVRIAASRIEEFAARVGIVHSAGLPQIGYSAEAGQEQISREIGLGKTPGVDRVSDYYNANLNVGWELDLWGRVRRAEESARADLLAQVETRRGVVLTIVADVATSYVVLLSLDEQLDIARQSVETWEQTLELFELQLSGGVISKLELAQVQSQYQRTLATIPAIEREIALVENSLSVLLGRPPGPIERGSTISKLTPPPIPAGVPSDLLRQRPDLRASEQKLISANAAIGQAIAEFYPRISLTGVLGLASDDLSNFVTSSASLYQIAASIAGPIYTAGRLQGQRDAAEAATQAALDAYLLDILTALRESEDALVVHSTSRDELDAQSRQVEALETYSSLAKTRYDNGYVGYLEVLDAERDLFDARLQNVRLRGSEIASVIGVYKAFGGGWIGEAEAIADAPPAEEESQD